MHSWPLQPRDWRQSGLPNGGKPYLRVSVWSSEISNSPTDLISIRSVDFVSLSLVSPPFLVSTFQFKLRLGQIFVLGATTTTSAKSLKLRKGEKKSRSPS